jgi:hypothetical protein
MYIINLLGQVAGAADNSNNQPSTHKNGTLYYSFSKISREHKLPGFNMFTKDQKLPPTHCSKNRPLNLSTNTPLPSSTTLSHSSYLLALTNPPFFAGYLSASKLAVCYSFLPGLNPPPKNLPSSSPPHHLASFTSFLLPFSLSVRPLSP